MAYTAVIGTATMEEAVTAVAGAIRVEDWIAVLSAIWSSTWEAVYPVTLQEVGNLKAGEGERGAKTVVARTLTRVMGEGPRATAAVESVTETIAQRSVFIQETSVSRLQAVIQRGDTGGRGAAERVRRVCRHFAGERAKRIAMQETLTAAAKSQHEAAQEVVARTGLTITRAWLTVGDGHVRTSHQVAEQTQRAVPMGSPFMVGGNYMMYPRDPAGSAAEVINCRCSEVYRRA